MYLGGNGFYWRVSFHPELPASSSAGNPRMAFALSRRCPANSSRASRANTRAFGAETGGRPTAWSGSAWSRRVSTFPLPIVVCRPAGIPGPPSVFEGVEDEIIGDFGLSGGGAAGLELDAVDHALGTPEHALVLASSERYTDVYLMTPEDMLDPVPGLGGTEADTIRSDMVFFETPNGGAVFSTGSIAWAGSHGLERLRQSCGRHHLKRAQEVPESGTLRFSQHHLRWAEAGELD